MNSPPRCADRSGTVVASSFVVMPSHSPVVFAPKVASSLPISSCAVVGSVARVALVTLVSLVSPVTLGGCTRADRESVASGESGIPGTSGETSGNDVGSQDGSDGAEWGDGGDETGGCPAMGCLDIGAEPAPLGCAQTGSCKQIDLLFVIDDSATMAEEQLNLARNFELLVERLDEMVDRNGVPIEPDVHVMVTSTDMPHPGCSPDLAGTVVEAGAPVTTPCLSRLSDFVSADGFVDRRSACAEVCPLPIAPTDPFIAWSPDGSNVPGGDVAGALACLGPQGIRGCGFEAPLEAMVQALNPTAPWNTGPNPFLRPDSLVGVVIVSDEEDCSVRRPDGIAAFVEDTGYWATHESIPGLVAPTSATCWKAGVTCDGPNAAGVFSSCEPVDHGVLHDVESRYVPFLRDVLGADHEVLMLGILGVPEVTAHATSGPPVPTAGGVHELVIRDWRPEDLLPGDTESVADKRFALGVGPGCSGATTGQGTPPVRLRAACESLDRLSPDGTVEPRCCIESICDDDFSAAMACLSGLVAGYVDPG